MKQFLFVCMAMVVFGSSSYGQILKGLGKRIGERVEQRTSQKIEQKAENTTDKVLDKALNPNLKKKQKQDEMEESTAPNNANTETAMPSSSGKAEIDRSYIFKLSVDISITEFDKKGKAKDPNTMTHHYSKEAFKTDAEGSETIINLEKQTAIVLDTESKTGQAMSLKWMSNQATTSESETDVQDADITIEKTGRTKTMHGYTCHEYKMTSDKGDYSEMWLAQDVPFYSSDYMHSFSRLLGKKSRGVSSTEGYLMHMINYNKKGVKEGEFEVTRIQEKTTTLSLESYTITKLF